MSITTTSASCFSATPRATVAPTLPAPPTTVTFRFISAPDSQRRASLHVFDHRVRELGRLQLGRAFHEAREVVGHALGGDGAVHPLHDEVRGLGPPEVPEHHLTGQNHRARVDL